MQGFMQVFGGWGQFRKLQKIAFAIKLHSPVGSEAA